MFCPSPISFLIQLIQKGNKKRGSPLFFYEVVWITPAP